MHKIGLIRRILISSELNCNRTSRQFDFSHVYVTEATARLDFRSLPVVLKTLC